MRKLLFLILSLNYMFVACAGKHPWIFFRATLFKSGLFKSETISKNLPVILSEIRKQARQSGSVHAVVTAVQQDNKNLRNFCIEAQKDNDELVVELSTHMPIDVDTDFYLLHVIRSCFNQSEFKSLNIFAQSGIPDEQKLYDIIQKGPTPQERNRTRNDISDILKLSGFKE